MRQKNVHTNAITTQGIGNLFSTDSIKGWLRGPAQVMFQGNALCGMLFIAAFFVGGAVEGRMAIAWGGIVGLSVATLTGHLLALPSRQGEAGLWGFNGTLVGLAIMTFLGSSVLSWAALILCAAMTTWVRTALDRICSAHRVSSMTAPFVLCTWLFLAAARNLSGLDIVGLDTPALPLHHPFASHTSGNIHFFEMILRGLSQVFLLDSWIAGGLILMGLLASNPLAALWGVIGSVLASGVAILYGAPIHLIGQGLYAFSPVLTAIALGSAFYRPSVGSTIWTLLGIVATLFIQAAFDTLLSPLGLPSLTAPFCLTTWLFLLPLYRFEPSHTNPVNHSIWHHKAHHNSKP